MVITIIILLLLAGVTINFVINGGILNNAGLAVDKYLNEQEREQEELEELYKKVNEMDNTINIPKEPAIEDKSGANSPNIRNFAQKPYVTWELNEAKTEYKINDTQTTQPDYWYDYENGKWAN